MGSRPAFRAPKGTKDLLPADAERLSAFERLFESLAGLYGFRPIVTPAFEQTEVFERGVGEATDIVGKEMYTFPDRAGRSMTLRPEETAPIVRAFVEHGIGKSEPLPWKVSYAGAMWRYERPQAGRMREFRQVGAESIGSEDPVFDVELIGLAMKFFSVLEIEDVALMLNSMGDAVCRPAYAKEFADFMRSAIAARHPLCDDCVRRLDRNPLRVLDCKNPGCRELAAEAPAIVDSLCDECKSHFAEVRSGLDAARIPNEIDTRLVRGLDYYTRTTFEFRFSALDAAQDAVGGGGRYDGLVEMLGGDSVPAIGFAIGVERTLAAMEISGSSVLSGPRARAVRAVVMPLVPDARMAALQVADTLRSDGIATEIGTPGRSAKAQMRMASRLGAGAAILIGADELAAGVVTLRYLEGETSVGAPGQERLAVDELPGRIRAAAGGA